MPSRRLLTILPLFVANASSVGTLYRALTGCQHISLTRHRVRARSGWTTKGASASAEYTSTTT